MTTIRRVYRVIRSILFAAVGFVTVAVLMLYLLLSIPAIQNKMRSEAEVQLSQLLKTSVTIGQVDFSPFNELQLNDVEIKTPTGEQCIKIERLGAGIALMRLIFQGRIIITYAELIGLDAHIYQAAENGPLNIQFIIDALKPKEPGKPPTRFDLKLNNIVIRKSAATFDRLWKTPKRDGRFDPAHLSVANLSADIEIPRLSNDEYKVKVRRLSFREKSGLYIDKLAFDASVSPKQLELKDFMLKMNSSEFKINDLKLDIDGYASIPERLKSHDFELQIMLRDAELNDFAFLYPEIANISGIYNISAEIDGKLDNLILHSLDINDTNDKFNLSLAGNIKGLPEIKSMSCSVSELELTCSSNRIIEFLDLIPKISDKVKGIVNSAGYLNLQCKGAMSLAEHRAITQAMVEMNQGDISIDAVIGWDKPKINGKITIDTDGFNLNGLLPKQPVGNVAFNMTADATVVGKDVQGSLDMSVPSIMLNGNEYRNIELSVLKQGQHITGTVSSNSPLADFSINAECELAGQESTWIADGVINNIDAAALGLKGKYAGRYAMESLNVAVHGNKAENMNGHVSLSGLQCDLPYKDPINLNALKVDVDGDDTYKQISVDCDILKADISGAFKYTDIPTAVTDVLAYAIPAYIKPMKPVTSPCNIAYNITLKPDETLYDAFKIPFSPVEPMTVNGVISDGNLSASVNAPYLLKGDSKLYKGTKLDIEATRDSGVKITGTSNVPKKSGYINVNMTASALANVIGTQLQWKVGGSTDEGTINLGMGIEKSLDAGTRFHFDILDSDLILNGAKWDLFPTSATFSDKVLQIDGLEARHGSQYLKISGKASSSPTDTLTARLKDIDLSYIFNTLNINYVTFGGFATGNAMVSQLFTKQPQATTDRLHIRDFSYNNARLGDADILGYWNNSNQSVAIYADVKHNKIDKSKIWGNIFVTRDSLGLNFDAHKINLALVHPFLGDILDDLSGIASGRLSLYGTFKNITLAGKAYADSASVKIGYTNVRYHGGDSVIFYPDRIHIPGFKVYDRYGNSAIFTGDVRHDYFHDAKIDFEIRDVKKLLCLDTDSRNSPVWWGKIFASGGGRITGRPGYTMLSFNVNTDPGSSFTFALDETITASEYDFLTFTDSHRQDEILSFEQQLEEKYSRIKPTVSDDEESSSVFELDMSVAANPGLKMNVIMDPSAGDKISAVGSGAMRINYNSFSDNLNVYGRYTIDEGSYRFSFQDIILRDFVIKSGSNISFNGDPMQGILNLTAGYRVNTNLTDLDKSFSTDRDLNRSSIPVEALLKVNGNLTQPDIAFDISLPTMTSEVEQKVRSIVSSEEMLNQQVLYLLALNRFYTPQYNGNSDGELVSVASSTLSSQVSNVLSQITDKVTLNPSFKSDRNDFSDVEVDLALSSQLFDNRLILNGNLGYRDRSVSQSTFVGDFDLEYLLTKDGRLRLKAYNHFNDAYYYLKSALTTQGIGILYRKDFDDAFKFLRPKRKKEKKKKTEEKK